MLDKKDISKIGIGAWGLGGFAKNNPDNDDQKQIDALIHQFKKGLNLVEINFWNSEGKSVELIKKALDKAKIKREEIFIIQVIYNYRNPSLDYVKKEFELCLKTFETDHVDSIEFPLSAFKKYGFDNLVDLVREYLDSGQARYTSVTNFNLEYLKKYHEIFKQKLFSHELHYSFEIRENESLGIIKYGLENDIINIPYQPLRRNRTAKRNWPLLVELSKKYNKTQNQIIINWMTSMGLKPLIKSDSINHIDENIEALDFDIDKNDLKRITNFKVPNYSSPKIDWFMENESADYIHSLANTFDERHPNNN